MENKLVAGIVAAAIAIIVLAGVLMPALDNATDTHDSFTNDIRWRMKEITPGDVWAFDKDAGTWKYQDVVQTTTSSSWNTLLGDNWCIRSNGQARGNDISGNASTITATVDEVQITFTGISGTLTQAITGYGVDDNGKYAMKYANTDVYVLEDSILYGTGQSTVDDVGVIIHVEGNVKDGVTFTMMSDRNGAAVSDVVFSNVQVNAVKIDGYKDLYKFTSVTADVAFNTTSGDDVTPHTGSAIYNGIVVPYEVNAEKAVHLDPAMNTILSVIPILIIVAVLLGVVAIFIIRRE